MKKKFKIEFPDYMSITAKKIQQAILLFCFYEPKVTEIDDTIEDFKCTHSNDTDSICTVADDCSICQYNKEV